MAVDDAEQLGCANVCAMIAEFKRADMMERRRTFSSGTPARNSRASLPTGAEGPGDLASPGAPGALSAA
ncbi:hypothetical protein [Bradyrhizobium sp. 87]|uniref:hypothetical protein n=1 Tax=Bradyrhizobium sp. 87 TaxID=2782682 RepID=UPI001FF9789C|nr:hypothetical protein [Bradyrhizobium sp. 87]MCK1427439.1 hypothetical protein [Bradyrhizobium sp. 87]